MTPPGRAKPNTGLTANTQYSCKEHRHVHSFPNSYLSRRYPRQRSRQSRFYPQDSLALAPFKSNEDSPHFALCPLARLDLDNVGETLIENHVQFIDWSEKLGTDVVTAYAVNHDPCAADDLAKYLLSEVPPLPTVLVIVQVLEVTSGVGGDGVLTTRAIGTP